MAEVRGPLTADDKAALDKLIARRDDSIEEVKLCAAEYKRASDAAMKEGYRLNWLHEQRLFDIINDNLPERYRVELPDRSYTKGASRTGDGLKGAPRRSRRPRVG